MSTIKNLGNYFLFSGFVILLWHTHETMGICGPTAHQLAMERLVPSLILLSLGIFLLLIHRRKRAST